MDNLSQGTLKKSRIKAKTNLPDSRIEIIFLLKLLQTQSVCRESCFLQLKIVIFAGSREQIKQDLILI